ncbi:MAG: site-specific integrase, partial [Coriobacteriales bacterium]|nr:site-specific integrase [Coriobacteriales bacterium]
MRSKKRREAPLFFSRTYDFLERYLPRQVGRSENTVESYRDALTVFRRFVRDERGLTVADMEFGDCTRDLVLTFLERLQERGCSAGTCNQRLATIKSYLWYAADRDVAIQSVALSVSRITPVRGPEQIKEKLSEAALAAILAQPDPSTRKGVRDRAMLVLLYDSGIRLSELLGLRVGDVRLGDDPRIYVTGKGDRERVVAITPATAAHLAAHLGCAHGPDPDPGDPLFYTRRDGS